MTKIKSVRGREVLDSRGNPTVEVEVRTDTAFGRDIAPSGASTGMYEAVELRDGDSRYNGKGVRKAVHHVNKTIAKHLKGKDVTKQKELDELLIGLDGTENKSRLGANAIVATSMAIARCAAASLRLPLYEYLDAMSNLLPVPMMNVINGGKHAGNDLNIQEFMIVPRGAKSFRESLRIGCEVYHNLKGILKDKFGPTATNVGDEGGYAPPLKKTSQALDVLVEAVEKSGYAKEVKLAMDCAASSFYDQKKSMYLIDGNFITKNKLLDYYENLVENYPIVSIEDPLFEEDFEGFAQAVKRLRGIQIVGDDLLVTNVKRIRTAIKAKSITALLLKVNQIGTLTESIEAANLIKKNKLDIVVSHRSGESESTTIADLAVALSSGQIKTGAPARGERTAKYNQLLRIEQELGNKARFGIIGMAPKIQELVGTFKSKKNTKQIMREIDDEF